jgi:ankyrin repeat protein
MSLKRKPTGNPEESAGMEKKTKPHPSVIELWIIRDIKNRVFQPCNGNKYGISDAKYNNMAFVAAASLGALEVMKRLKNSDSIDVDTYDCLGYTAVHYACEQGDIDTFNFLVSECKCDIKTVSKLCKNTALHKLISGFRKKTENGEKPLPGDVLGNYLYIAEYLTREAGDKKNASDDTALENASLFGQIDIVRCMVPILKERVTKDKFESNIKNAIEMALYDPNIDVIEYLVGFATSRIIDSFCKRVYEEEPHLVHTGATGHEAIEDQTKDEILKALGYTQK